MDRAKELKKILNGSNENTDNNILLDNLVDEIVFIEKNLIELKKLPFISVNPRNPCQQKTTAAAKQYKELLQQYTNCLKVISKATGQDIDDEESPLRKWVKKRIGGG